MTLSAVSSSALVRLRTELQSARLACPVSRDGLARVGIRSQRPAIERALGSLDVVGCLAVVEAVLAEREVQERPPPELVWTGPEGERATARDTAVVLGQLFEGARERVVLAGYRFLNARKVLEPLHRAMAERNVRTVLFVDVAQPKAGDPQGDVWGRIQLARFLDESWPFGAPYPELHCDRRALAPAPPWCSLHAKCVSVDGAKAFLSSANFTERGQERNLEAGVLVHDAPFAEQLERQWLGLVSSGLTCRHRVSDDVPAEAPATDGGSAGTADDFEALYPHTREREALEWLAGQGVPAPDETGADVTIDDEVVACLEWRWRERRIGLLVAGTSPEAGRTLQGAGWRTIASTDEPELRRLVDWLREEET